MASTYQVLKTMDNTHLQPMPSSLNTSERNSNEYSPSASFCVEGDRQSNHSITKIPQPSTGLSFAHFPESCNSSHRTNISEVNDPNPRLAANNSGTGNMRHGDRKNIVLCFDGTGTQECQKLNQIIC